MNNQRRIIDIWRELEQAQNIGLLKKLYPTHTNFRIYGTFQYPDNYFGIAFSFNKDISVDISLFENFKQMKVMLFPDKSFDNSKLLIIQLLQSISTDIFATLCENLISSISQLTTEQTMIRTVITQLGRWKTLFEKNNIGKLSTSEQQGLYGELCFLQKLLSKADNQKDIINTWTGVDSDLRDFQGQNWAVEVKTTSTNNPQKVTINNERQLDETLVNNLFLFHYSVEVSKVKGTSLPQKVVEIRQYLKENAGALSLFNTKLFEVGYADDSQSFYQDKFYLKRNEALYKIESNFPRIKESELRKGVSDVKYSIILAMCDEYLFPENKFFNIVKEI